MERCTYIWVSKTGDQGFQSICHVSRRIWVNYKERYCCHDVERLFHAQLPSSATASQKVRREPSDGVSCEFKPAHSKFYAPGD